MLFLRFLAPCAALALVAAGCGALPDSITIDFGNGTPDVNAIVQATFQSMTAMASVNVASTATAPGVASISGSLNYPADSLPAMYVAAFEVGTQNYRYVITAEGQPTYQIDGLTPGNYEVVAYTVGSQSFPAGLAGGYTQAVLCGLGAGCGDHTLVNIPVAAGQAVTGINPADWYLVEGAFPVFPGVTSTGVDSTTPPFAASTGGIAGSLMYPASEVPALRIVAFQAGGSSYYYVDTLPGQSSYTIEDLPPGTYHVVAYVRPGGGFTSGPAGGYSQMVPCGLQYSCSDHSLIDVVVDAGSVTAGVDPNDFYADPGTFPPNPAP
jgi:hypothetical protein